MKKRTIRSLVVALIAVMVITMMPVTVSAASKKPGKVKITSMKVSAVSAATNKCTVTIKWKKASNAKSYVVYAKHGDGQWVKQKKLGSSYRKLKITGVPAGKLDIRIQAVNKKKKGKFSAIKSRFIASPLTLQQYVDRFDPSWKTTNGSTKVYCSYNTMIIDFDAEMLGFDWANYNDSQKELVRSEFVKDLAGRTNLKSAVVTNRNYFVNNCGIASYALVARYVYRGEVLAQMAY